MEMMGAQRTWASSIVQSWDGSVSRKEEQALTVDFERFYSFWSSAKGNFTDPIGFCDLATVRPIWEAPGARRSLDCVGEFPHTCIGNQPADTLISTIARCLSVLKWHHQQKGRNIPV